MTTTHDAYRSAEETLFNNFQRHSSIHSPATASLASFRSMTASDLIGLLPGTPQTSQRQHPQRHQQQQRSRMTRDRPASDFIHSHLFNGKQNSSSHLTESEEIDQWFENIQRYELMLEEVAAASLDETFKDELQHVNQWIRCRSDAERTAALYSVVQNASQIQIRFLIMVLQQLVNQDPFGNILTAGQDKDSLIASVAGSVVSTESEYERRKRHLYTSAHRRSTNKEINNSNNSNNNNNNNNTNVRSPIRITSASSEPDDLRRNRDLFGSSRSLVDSSTINSVLGRQGLLHEKALAARAQILAANSGGRAAALAAAKSNNPSGRLQQQPQLHLSNTLSTPTRTPSSLESNITTDTPSKHPSLFGTDWPFPMTRHTERSSLVGRIGDHRSTSSKSSVDDAWSFNSALSKRKKDLMDLPSWNGRKSGPIREEQESTNDLPIRPLNKTSPTKSSRPPITATAGSKTGGMLNSSLNNSLNALELAQARLRGESTKPRTLARSSINSPSNGPEMNTTSPTTLSTSSPSNSTKITPPSTLAPPSPTTTATLDIPTMSPRMIIPSSTTGSLGQFLTPPTVYENQVLETSISSTTNNSNVDYQSDHSDGSTGSAKENTLTGTARRRKRSSAARALKDKIAAETVDLELMKDVQNWLRSLRLHKYGHAFTGLQWQQVIRMNDQDMIDAGVNTIGARRKLLKVFENVQRHCEENDIDY